MFKKLNIVAWRRISQTVFGLILSNSYFNVVFTKTIYDGPLKAACIPFLNCHACPFAVVSCPIGMMQHFVAVRRLPIFLLGFFITIGMVVGRATCGWLCPFGLIQDMMYKIKTKKIQIPRLFNYFKYASLVILVILLPYFTYKHWFSRLCPFGALIAGIPWVAWNPTDPVFEEAVIAPETIGLLFYTKISILVFFLILFVISKRPFCRTTCPLGAIYALFNRISLLRFKIGEDCYDCPTKCNKICPMDLKVNKEVDSENCIKCFDCTTCEHVKAKFQI